MHPIERLRHVARASHIPSDVLAREAALALIGFVDDDAGLLIACKRILDRQPTTAALVWLIAHALGAPDARHAMWTAVEELEEDRSERQLAVELPPDAMVAMVGWSSMVDKLARRRGDIGFVLVDTDGSADYQTDRLIDDGHRVLCVDAESIGQAMHEATHLVIELDALGPAHGVAAMGTFPAAAVARQLDLPVLGLARLGTALPGRMYDGLVRRWHERERDPRWLRESEEIPSGLVDQVIATSGPLAWSEALAKSGCPIVPELF